MRFLRRILLAASIASFVFTPAFAADLSQTAASVIGYGEQVQGRCGGTITAGMPIRKQTDGTFVASTNASAAGAQVDGIALTGCATAQPVTYQKGGNINLGATVAAGVIYVLSAAGAISAVNDVVSGDYITVIGIGISTTLVQMAIVNSGVATGSDVT